MLQLLLCGVKTSSGAGSFRVFARLTERGPVPNAPLGSPGKFSFQPTRNLEFGFSRVVIFAPGKDHVPLTFGSLNRLRKKVE
jgi:hypothetical protein